jgi:hypothetical protein
MAKSEDKPEEAKEAEAEQKPAPQQQKPVPVDDSDAVCRYANFCRVTGTPEELIVDFGLNSQPLGQAPEKLVITQRIVVNYFTAKRLLGALTMSVQRHEAAFGVLETDVQRRVQPGAFSRPAAPQGAPQPPPEKK